MIGLTALLIALMALTVLDRGHGHRAPVGAGRVGIALAGCAAIAALVALDLALGTPGP